MFFLLQAAGIVLQQSVVRIFKPWVLHTPRILRKVGNLAFAIVWLYMTSCLFIDDLASFGLWLLEPVPLSLFRALGFGQPGDHWWRWDYHYYPRWYSGQSLWENGIAI